MPYEDPDPEDPTLLVGVRLPGSRDSFRQMAEAFADEFAMLGFDEPRILSLFRQPYYAAAHSAMRELGEDSIRRIVGESVRFWSRFRVEVEDCVPGPCECVSRGSDTEEPSLLQILEKEERCPE